MGAVECELARIIISETSPNQVIVLREKHGRRVFQIVIGIVEAMAIHREISGEKLPRPLTHDLLSNVIRELGAKLERIVVNDLRDGTFYARLLLRREGELYDVDSRPSDAIALAVRTASPIFVEERVLAAVARSAEEGALAPEAAAAGAESEEPDETAEELADLALLDSAEEPPPGGAKGSGKEAATSADEARGRSDLAAPPDAPPPPPAPPKDEPPPPPKEKPPGRSSRKK